VKTDTGTQIMPHDSEAKIRVRKLQAMEHQKLPVTPEAIKKHRFSCSLQREHGPTHLVFRLLASRTGRQ
jgi:hypothetical protein